MSICFLDIKNAVLTMQLFVDSLGQKLNFASRCICPSLSNNDGHNSFNINAFHMITSSTSDVIAARHSSGYMYTHLTSSTSDANTPYIHYLRCQYSFYLFYWNAARHSSGYMYTHTHTHLHTHTHTPQWFNFWMWIFICSWLHIYIDICTSVQ